MKIKIKIKKKEIKKKIKIKNIIIMNNVLGFLGGLIFELFIMMFD